MLEPLAGHLLRVSLGHACNVLTVDKLAVGMTTTLVCVSSPVPTRCTQPGLCAVTINSDTSHPVAEVALGPEQMRAMGLDCVAHFCVHAAMHRLALYG